MLHKLEIDKRGVATVTLNRPEIHNAFNENLIQQLIDAFLYIDRSENVRVVVLTGEGKSFCAGADLNWMKRMKDYTYEENLVDSKKLCDLFTVINFCRFPVIGKVNGHALGGGAGLVACCDYVVAVDTALMGFTEVKLGLVPAVISPFVLAKIGESHARATFLSGERFKMEKAMLMGLVHQISSQEDLDKNTNIIVEGFLTAAPHATVTAKALIKNVIKYNSVTGSRDYTCETISTIRAGKEGQEGMSALLDKRKASWI
jgi:methylglutaconyl-CoA hydratase